MIEYKCEALQEGYAKKIEFMGQEIVLCQGKTCGLKHMEEIYIDAEPKKICLVNGITSEKKSLAQKVQNIPRENSPIIRIRII